MQTTQITKADVTKAEDLLLTDKQLNMILGKTPDKYIKERKGKGGGTWKFVNVAYINKCLNLMFGWDWDFEIVDEKILELQVIVKGRLTCRFKDRKIIKMQYGRKDIVFKKETKIPLDIGNDLKAAASDALKKCASSIGIAGDIYGGDDFKDVEVVSAPSLEDQNKAKEEERIAEFIKNASSLEQLKEAQSFITLMKGESFKKLIDLYFQKQQELI